MTSNENTIDKVRDNRGRFLPGHGTWKPGESGNPEGRPKGDLCITSLVKELLEQDAGQGKTYAKLVAEAIVKLATTPDARGHVPTVKELLDRIEGKVADKHILEGDIPVSIVYKSKE